MRENVSRPGMATKIEKEGMPILNNPSTFGDLYVEYNIVFPTSLTAEQKVEIAKILGPMNGNNNNKDNTQPNDKSK